MGQFKCETCGQEFEQKSKYEKHLETSHPERAQSVADLSSALKGIEFPASKKEVLSHLQSSKELGGGLLNDLNDIKEHVYRDSAEVARAFGEVKSGQSAEKQGAPSQKGGKAALRSLSAARITQIFSGVELPKQGDELKSIAKNRANDDEWSIIKNFKSKKYHDMSDIAKEMGRVTQQMQSK